MRVKPILICKISWAVQLTSWWSCTRDGVNTQQLWWHSGVAHYVDVLCCVLFNIQPQQRSYWCPPGLGTLWPWPTSLTMAWTLTSASDLVAAPGEAFLMGTFIKPELYKHLDIMLRRGQQAELLSLTQACSLSRCGAWAHQDGAASPGKVLLCFTFPTSHGRIGYIRGVDWKTSV